MAEPERPPCPIGDGGGGGPSDDRKTADLTRRAIKERWPIPDGIRATLPGYLAGILEDSEDARARVAAARALLAADQINMEQEKRDLQIPDRVQVSGDPANPLKHEHTVPASLLARLDAYAAAFEGAADREEAGDPSGDGPRQPVDPGTSQARPHPG